ncbi:MULTISPECIES: TraR/DksA family transcriptional regulator [unclassified Micromonospora]|uniref:TraR/DksA family transcriptional regulator n=1 Tax=unclassified Micromonospora TaxID=2617518 RepID=UPI003A886C84
MSTELHGTRGTEWIEQVRVQLADQLDMHRAQLTELTADTGDPGEAHTRAALVVAARRGYDQTVEALNRIAAGRYGRCDRCGGDIPRERLEILPHARYCVPCTR